MNGVVPTHLALSPSPQKTGRSATDSTQLITPVIPTGVNPKKWGFEYIGTAEVVQLIRDPPATCSMQNEKQTITIETNPKAARCIPAKSLQDTYCVSRKETVKYGE